MFYYISDFKVCIQIFQAQILSSPSYYIKYNLNSATRVGYFPMKFDDLKAENIKLYNILKDRISDKTSFISLKC